MGTETRTWPKEQNAGRNLNNNRQMQANDENKNQGTGANCIFQQCIARARYDRLNIFEHLDDPSSLLLSLCSHFQIQL